MLERYSEATTRDEQMAMLDELLLKWSETSTMATMFERARSEGFAVIYKLGNLDEVPDLIGLASASNSQLPKTPKGLSDFLAEAYSSETRAEYQRWFRMIGVMERFNGEEFHWFFSATQKQSNAAQSNGIWREDRPFWTGGKYRSAELQHHNH